MNRQTHNRTGPAPDDADLSAATEARSPPLCPEIRLRLKPADMPLDAFRAEHAALIGAAPPYWAVAWPGGQALARYLLDNPDIVRGHSAVDFGAGSGLVAIAARMAGATHVVAIDRDPVAVAMSRLNARLNGVMLHAHPYEIAGTEAIDAEFVLAGDLWYEPFDGRRATTVLRALAQHGATVLIGDPGRAHLPRAGVEWLTAYDVPADETLEPSARVEARVGRLVG